MSNDDEVQRRLDREIRWDSRAADISLVTRRLWQIRMADDLSDANARVKTKLDDLREELNNWPGMTRYVRPTKSESFGD